MAAPARTPARTMISTTDAARRLGVDDRTLRAWISRGLLPGYRVGPRLIRVDPVEVEALIRRIPTAGTT